jgi:peptide/nickel transport system substrate-binding protein
MNALNRRRLLTSGAAAAIFAATGLGASAAPVKGGHLRLGLSGGSAADAFASPRAFGTFLKVAGAGMVFDTLTEVAADGTLRGELATDWESRDGARVWDIRLRDGVRFHDGRPFTADDAVASIRRHLKSTTPLAPLFADVTEVRRLSGGSLRVTLAAPNVDFPFLLSDPHLVMHPVRDVRAALAAGIGTGPYSLVAFELGHRLLAERAAGHWTDGDRAWFDSVELLSLPARHDRIEALVQGRVDLVDDVDPRALEILRRLPKFSVEAVRGNGRLIALPPAGLDPAQAASLRAALVHGLPREMLADRLLAGHGAPGWDTPVGPANLHADAQPVDWDPDRARDLLAGAGLSGLPLALGPVAAQDEALSAALGQAGFRLSPGAGAVTLRPASGRPTEGWAFSTRPSADLPWVAGDKTRARFDALLRDGRAATSSALRAGIFGELQRLVAALGSAAVPLHADFVFAGTARLAHGPALGRTATLDDARIAKRWWFA